MIINEDPNINSHYSISCDSFFPMPCFYLTIQLIYKLYVAWRIFNIKHNNGTSCPTSSPAMEIRSWDRKEVGWYQTDGGGTSAQRNRRCRRKTPCWKTWERKVCQNCWSNLSRHQPQQWTWTFIEWPWLGFNILVNCSFFLDKIDFGKSPITSITPNYSFQWEVCGSCTIFLSSFFFQFWSWIESKHQLECYPQKYDINQVLHTALIFCA